MNYSNPNGYIVYIINYEDYLFFTTGYWFETYEEMIDSFNGNVIWNHERGMYIVSPEFISERDYNELAQDLGFEAENEDGDILTFSSYEEMMSMSNTQVTWNHERLCYIYQAEEMELLSYQTTNEL